jgi:hypothetical protein
MSYDQKERRQWDDDGDEYDRPILTASGGRQSCFISVSSFGTDVLSPLETEWLVFTLFRK